jgi:hypothetical protein
MSQGGLPPLPPPPEAQQPAAPEPEPKRLPPAPHADRFRFVLGAILGLGLAAIVATVALALKGPSSQDAWSAWKPTKDGTAGASQIASHVSATYRSPDGEQLVAVKGGAMKVADLDLNVAVSKKGGDEIVSGSGVRYVMCGLGPNCSIASGKPSVERGVLLQREALELALYSFEYLSNIDQVVVFMPPRPGENPTQGKALFFQKDDVGKALDQPLRKTLSTPTPSFDSLRASDVAAVDQFAARHVYCFSYQVGQDVSAYLVLSAPRNTCPGTSAGSGGASAGP